MPKRKPKEPEIKVTDHALSRYLERVHHLSIDQIKREILTDQFLKTWRELKADGTYPTGKGYSLVVKSGVVVTLVKKTNRFKPSTKIIRHNEKK